MSEIPTNKTREVEGPVALVTVCAGDVGGRKAVVDNTGGFYTIC